MLCIDLGCGTKKHPGFIGVDRYALAGVDVIADMNQFLPFRDDSVDLLLASHSLEHLEDLLATIQEIYRICKHGAQLFIIAPYNEQKLNWANPYHKCVFNEHTPRFWTDYPYTPVNPDEYIHPHAWQWGLSKTDNSHSGVDIRTIRMEYFYFPKYAGLSPLEQRELRQERTDICDQITYHLIVWKGDELNGGRPFEDYVAGFEPYEPAYIAELRNQGREMSLQNRAADALADGAAEVNSKRMLEELRRAHHQQLSSLSAECEILRQSCAAEVQVSGRLRQELASAKEDANQLRAHSLSFTREITRLHEHCAAETDALRRLTHELHETAAHNRTLRGERVGIERELELARSGLLRESAIAAAAQEEVAILAQQNRDLETKLESSHVLRAKLGLTRAELETTNALLSLQRQKAEGISGEIAAIRREAAGALEQAERWKTLWSAAKRSLSALAVETRIPEFAPVVRVGGFIIGRYRQNQGLPNEFGALREYCDRHLGTARACIALGGDLAETIYREYVIPFAPDRLAAISIAIRPALAESPGVLGVEIVSARSEILAQVRGELATLNRNGVMEFRLPEPLVNLGENWLLRVFVRDTGAPVSVYELVKGGLFRATGQSFPLMSFR